MIEEKWQQYSLAQQLGNIGSEVLRAINREKIGDAPGRANALERALDLISLTLDDAKNRGRLKEITRLQELLADNYVNANYYQVGLVELQKYLLPFALRAKK